VLAIVGLGNATTFDTGVSGDAISNSSSLGDHTIFEFFSDLGPQM